MKHVLPLILSLVWSVCVCGQIPGAYTQEYCRGGREWLATDTIRDSVPEAYSALEAHLRIRVPSHRELDVSIIYDRTDSLNYSKCRMWRTAGSMDERLAAAPLSLEVIRVGNGADSLLLYETIRRGLDPACDDYSLKLSVNPQGAVVSVGQKKEVWRGILPVEGKGGGELQWICGADTRLVRRSLSFDKTVPRRYSRFGSQEELAAYLRQSADVHEGFWTYFDRDTDRLRMGVGGDYRLATVKAESGNGYEIIYLGGARTNAAGWEPLQIKGYLRDTGFIDHFDLEWIDAAGVMQKRETSADITDGASLTLYFPLQKSKIRYRRLQAH